MVVFLREKNLIYFKIQFWTLRQFWVSNYHLLTVNIPVVKWDFNDPPDFGEACMYPRATNNEAICSFIFKYMLYVLSWYCFESSWDSCFSSNVPRLYHTPDCCTGVAVAQDVSGKIWESLWKDLKNLGMFKNPMKLLSQILIFGDDWVVSRGCAKG